MEINGYRLISEWQLGSVQSLATFGSNELYVGFGKVMRVYDISDKRSPSLIAERPDTAIAIGGGAQYGRFMDANDIAVVTARKRQGISVMDKNFNVSYLNGFYGMSTYIYNNEAYVPTGDSIKVVDISDPRNPKVTNTIEVDADIVVVDDDKLSVASGYNLTIYDKDTLETLFTYQIGGRIYDLVGKDNLLFASDYDRTVIIDKDTLSVLGKYEPHIHEYRKVAVYNDILFVAIHDSSLRAVDISNPSSPIELRYTGYTTGYPMCIDVTSDGYVVLGLSYGGFDIYDTELNKVYSWFSAHNHRPVGDAFSADISSDGRVAFYSEDKGVYAIDVTSEYGRFLGYNNCLCRSINMKERDYKVFVAAGCGGLSVVDFSNPTNPDWRTKLNSSWYVLDVEIYGDYVISGDSDSKIRIYNINDIDGVFVSSDSEIEKHIVTTLDFGSDWNYPDMEVHKHYLLCSQRYKGSSKIHLIDISNITEPRIVFSIEVSREIGRVEFNKDNDGIYYATDDSGSTGKLLVLQGSNIVKEIELPDKVGIGYVTGALRYKDNKLYVGTGNILTIFDVTVPTDPVPEDTIEFIDNTCVRDIKFKDRYMVLAGNETGIRVFSTESYVSPPSDNIYNLLKLIGAIGIVVLILLLCRR